MVFGFLSRLGQSIFGSGGISGFLKPITGFISRVVSPLKNMFAGRLNPMQKEGPGDVGPGLMGKVNYAVDHLLPQVANLGVPYVNKAREFGREALIGARDAIGDSLGKFGRNVSDILINRIMPSVGPGESPGNVYGKGLTKIN